MVFSNLIEDLNRLADIKGNEQMFISSSAPHLEGIKDFEEALGSYFSIVVEVYGK